MSVLGHNKHVVGICGPIGSGKSMVRRCLEVLWDMPTYDCDTYAKQLYYEEVVRRELIDKVGIDPVNKRGELDKAAIGKALAVRKSQVEAIVHGALFDHLGHWIQEQTSNLVVVESAILYTSGLYKFCDTVIAIHCDREKRRERVRKRDPMRGERDFEKIEELQAEERSFQETKADYQLINDSQHSVIKQITRIYNELNRKI